MLVTVPALVLVTVLVTMLVTVVVTVVAAAKPMLPIVLPPWCSSLAAILQARASAVCSTLWARLLVWGCLTLAHAAVRYLLTRVCAAPPTHTHTHQHPEALAGPRLWQCGYRGLHTASAGQRAACGVSVHRPGEPHQ